MPRIARGLVDGFIYHVINRGNGQQVVFRKNEDYKAFLRVMKKAKQRYAVKVYSYCLMPDHFHMVLSPVKAQELSRWMQWVMTSHVRRYHHYYGTSGHVWQGRFKSFIVEQDDHLVTLMRYVEGNPVRAGLVGSATDWAWSSHRETLGQKSRKLIDEIPIELPGNWERFVDDPLPASELEKLRESVKRQCPYGSASWHSEWSEKLGLESTLRLRGRPKKPKMS